MDPTKTAKKGDSVPVAVYPCASCQAWHLTSKPQRVRGSHSQKKTVPSGRVRNALETCRMSLVVNPPGLAACLATPTLALGALLTCRKIVHSLERSYVTVTIYNNHE